MWKQKLSSRKLWAAVIGFVTALLVAFGVDEPTVQQIAGTITAISTLLIYIISESRVDSTRGQQTQLPPALPEFTKEQRESTYETIKDDLEDIMKKYRLEE